ncbi:putative purine permease 5 [Citrus sinensis]|nr:putative purine permease 5 [Citrus sinensis]
MAFLLFKGSRNLGYRKSNLGSNSESNKRRRFNPSIFFLNQVLKRRRFGKIVAVAGWPLTALILWPAYFVFKTFPTPLDLKLTLAFIVLGFLTYLSASTATLLASSSLVFSTLFDYFLVKNKLNAAMINVVVIITAAMTIIALDLDSDRYGSALHGLIFALSELVFVKLVGRRSLLP